MNYMQEDNQKDGRTWNKKPVANNLQIALRVQWCALSLLLS